MNQAAIKQRYLKGAEQNMAEGARRIARQQLLVAQLQRDGHDAAEARKLLINLQCAQAKAINIRNLLLTRLAAGRRQQHGH